MSTAVELTPAVNDEVALRKVEWRWPITAAIMTILTMLLAIGSHGDSVFSMRDATPWFDMKNIVVPAAATNWILAVLGLAGTAWVTRQAMRREKVSLWAVSAVGAFVIIAFLTWTVAGRADATMPVVRLLAGALAFAVPLIFGSLSGVVCERSGIINLAIEAQMLVGAFAAVLVASIAGSPWIGVLAAPVAGVGVAALLALFAIRYRVNHIIVGVVLNMLVLGLTSFLFQALFTGAGSNLNQALLLPSIPIPVLSGIPVLGPVFFNQSILVYLAFIAAAVLQFLIFRSRWGLRTRSVGEYPMAADTVGIKVNALRWRNTLLGGALAGMGGAMFTIGFGLAFSKNMVAGNGYIALAAMILGGWNPKGAVAAAALFGFATNLGFIMQTVGAPIPTEFLLMIPYAVTILAVAGFVKSAKPPAAEGEPYP